MPDPTPIPPPTAQIAASAKKITLAPKVVITNTSTGSLAQPPTTGQLYPRGKP